MIRKSIYAMIGLVCLPMLAATVRGTIVYTESFAATTGGTAGNYDQWAWVNQPSGATFNTDATWLGDQCLLVTWIPSYATSLATAAQVGEAAPGELPVSVSLPRKGGDVITASLDLLNFESGYGQFFRVDVTLGVTYADATTGTLVGDVADLDASGTWLAFSYQFTTTKDVTEINAFSLGIYSPVGSYFGTEKNTFFDNIQVDVQAIPEPSTLLLLGWGCLMFGGWRRPR